MKDLGRNWVDRLAANSRVPAYTFDEKVKSVLKSLICEELGPVYYEICEEAVSIVSNDLKQYITHLPEGKVKKRLSQFVESHVPKLISQIDAVNLSNECNDCFLERF
jgi:hypothetical protein